jgi:hypothetical protein
MASFKHSTHEWRHTGNTDVISKQHYPDKTLSFEAVDGRALEMSNLPPANVAELIGQHFEGLVMGMVEFGAAFTEVDAILQNLVAIRNAQATEAGDATVGTLTVA